MVRTNLPKVLLKAHASRRHLVAAMDRPPTAVVGHQGEYQITTLVVEQVRESPQVRENPRCRIMVAVVVAVTNHLMVVVVLVPVAMVRLPDQLDQ